MRAGAVLAPAAPRSAEASRPAARARRDGTSAAAPVPRIGGVDAAQVAAVFRDNPTLATLYLLRQDLFRDRDRPEAEKRQLFLLWFAVFGKEAHPQAHPLSASFLRHVRQGEDGLAGLRAYVEAFRPDLLRREGGFAEVVRRQRLGCFSVDPAPSPTGITVPAAAIADGGVSIVGFPSGAFGIGEDARCLFRVLRGLGLSVNLVDLTGDHLERIAEADALEPYCTDTPLFRTVIVCMPPFEMARVVAEKGPGFLAGHHVVGYWPWELTDLPAEWLHVFDLVDEVWAISRFLEVVWRRLTDKPVTHVPLLVDVDDPEDIDLGAFGIDGSTFNILVMFDVHSTMARKNPAGAIAAFRLAFPGDPGVRLLVKTTHGQGRPEFEALLALAEGDERIVFVDGVLRRREVLGLIRRMDVFLSLHRAEGFGRILAEALQLGTRVVMTAWSGPLEFADTPRAIRVACTTRPVLAHEYPHAAGSWAEPDIRDAAHRLRSLRCAMAAEQSAMPDDSPRKTADA